MFDVGLGAGSNAFAARAASERAGAGRLELVSFERDLGALALALESPAAFGIDARGGDGGARAPRARPPRDARARRGASSRETSSRRSRARSARADVVYWDPFSPRANPTLWTVAAFAAIRRAAGPRCTLFTYSASTATRVALLLSDWAVGVGDAIGEKAHTTAAAVDPADLARPLDRAWLGAPRARGRPVAVRRARRCGRARRGGATVPLRSD